MLKIIDIIEKRKKEIWWNSSIKFKGAERLERKNRREIRIFQVFSHLDGYLTTFKNIFNLFGRFLMDQKKKQCVERI